MATDLASLVVSLEAETAKYQKELEKARGKLGKFEKDASAAVTQIAQAAGAAAAAAAVAFGAMAKASIDNADRLAKLAQSTGITTEALSQLDYVAGLSGATSEELGAALNKLAKSSVGAAEGAKEQAAAFQTLGVKVTDATGKMRPAEELLTDVAEAFSQIQDGPAKAALAMDIFGKSGANLIPFLNNGRKGLAELREEAHAFGLTVTEEAAKASEQFNDNLDRLKAAATGAANQITAQLLPALVSLTDASVEFAKNSGSASAVVDGLAVAFKTAVAAGAVLVTVIGKAGQKIGGLVAQANAILNFEFGDAARIGLMMAEDAAAADAQMTVFIERLFEAKGAAEETHDAMKKWAVVIRESKAGTLDDQRAAMLGLASAYQAGEFGAVGSAEATRAYEAAIAKALPTIGKKQIALKGVAAAAGATKSALDGLLTSLQAQAATLGMSAEQAELYRLRVAGASAKQLQFASDVLAGVKAFDEQKAALEEGKRVTESLLTPAEALSAEYARLAELQQRGALGQEAYNRAIIAAQNAFVAADPEIQKAIDSYRELSDLLASTPTGQLEKQRKLMLDLAAAYQRGELGAVGSTEAVRRYGEAAQTALGTLPAATEQSTDLMQELTAEAARNMQGALADFLFDPFSGGVEGMVDSFAKALQRMAAEAAAAQIFEAMGFGAKGSSGGMDGILGSLASAALGAFTGTQAPSPVAEAAFTPIPGRAHGGGMRAGKPYWTGELGPELVFPGSTSRILSAKDSAELMQGGPREIRQTFNISTPNPDAFRASERQITRRARGALQR